MFVQHHGARIFVESLVGRPSEWFHPPIVGFAADVVAAAAKVAELAAFLGLEFPAYWS